jgi:hypothetical protein
LGSLSQWDIKELYKPYQSEPNKLTQQALISSQSASSKHIMHSTVLFLIVAAISAAAAVHGHRPADGTPAARFWEEVLPGTPMPDALVELVQKGVSFSGLFSTLAKLQSLPFSIFNFPSLLIAYLQHMQESITRRLRKTSLAPTSPSGCA